MTQEFVTLPREVVEQAIEALFCTDSEEGSTAYENELKAVKKLRAALEQPQGEQEPVAWAEKIIEYLHAHYDTEMIKELDSGDALIRLDDAIAAVEEVEQRYTHPQPNRNPLTDEQIDAIADAMPGGLEGFLRGWGWRQFARAVLEAAHNIK